MPSPNEGNPELAASQEILQAELLRKNLKIVRFRDLCRCGEEIWIENDGEVYRLRKTRQGKLILTK
jgi:hemin uptake protein HemP